VDVSGLPPMAHGHRQGHRPRHEHKHEHNNEQEHDFEKPECRTADAGEKFGPSSSSLFPLVNHVGTAPPVRD
jgi:hypothetical protein